MEKISLCIVRLVVGLALMSVAGVLHAQNKPDASSRPAATPATVPGAYSNTTINYIRSWELNMSTSDPAAVSSSTDINAVKQTTQYFDGLGRTLQTVSRGMSPLQRDLVAPVKYDADGKEQLKYLPYVPQPQSGNINDGKFKTDPFKAQQVFYQTAAPGAAGETIYYNRIEYEASILNRTLKSFAPGNTWAKEGGNRPLEQLALVNTTADGVRIWDITATSNIPVSSSGSVYPVGELYKTVAEDERNLRVVEFKDKNDRLILKKVELTAGSSDGHDGWLCTYYVYDDLGNLRCVIPPKAVNQIKTSWVINAAVAEELCFFYRYDDRNRMIVKKVPGADTVEMVYDVRDRLVFTRDGNLKNPNQAGGVKWLVTFYDGQNRQTMTALYNSSASRETLQTSMNGATVNTQDISYTFPAVADLVVASHDGRAKYEATNSITLEDGFDSGTGEMLAEVNGTANTGTIVITATNPLPSITAASLMPLTYTFYDDYTFAGKQDPVTADFTAPQYTGSLYPEVINVASNLTKGLVTGSKVRVLGTNQWLTSTTYYTDKGRMLQTISDNNNGGKNIATNLYDFSGKLLSAFLRHTNPRSSTLQTRIMTQLLYDHAGRVTQVMKQLNDGVKQTIAQNAYDELGRLQTKRLHVIDENTQLETLNYEYNIRGWLKGINKAFVNNPNSQENWFGQELSYDYGFLNNQYNGNIAGVKWKGRGDGIRRAYGYTYDNANRLTNADFTQLNTATTTDWTQDKMNFSVEQLTYDPNGNIVTMTQKGLTGTGAPVNIDQLTYSYSSTSVGNKLTAVSDGINSTAPAKLGDFINGANTGDDYAYDANANLTKDLNKNITAITYNHLNLPETITVSGKGTINFQYDASGNKLRKIVTDNTSGQAKITTTDYMAGLVYSDNILQFINHEEGRIRAVYNTGLPPEFYYDYFIKDYQGNVRSVLTEQTDFTMYSATMETARAATETALFSNVEETRAVKPVGYPEDKAVSGNQYVAKLNAKDGGKKIGPSLVLKLMAGDTIQIGARAFYKSVRPKDSKSVTPEDMLADLLQAFGGEKSSAASHTAGQATRSTPLANLNSNDYQRLKEKDPGQNQTDRPKAYLNFVFFDEQFNLVDENSGVRQVKGTADELQTLTVDKMPVKKNGFLYVYTSNETEQDVFFDNVILGVAAGPLLEETHYYPFGLTIAPISSNALKGTDYPENKARYNGKELQNKEFKDDSGLEWYDYEARMYDPQIGRWHVQDPMSNKYYGYSPYNYVLNDPISLIDPDGKDVKETDDYIHITGRQDIELFLASWKARRKEMEGDDNEKGKGRKKNKQSSVPFLLPLLGEGSALTGAGASAGAAGIFPTAEDWTAAGNDFRNKMKEFNASTSTMFVMIAAQIYNLLPRSETKPTVQVDPAMVKKLSEELTNLYQKVLNKDGVVYALTAKTDGNYNIYVSGSPLPLIQQVPLKAGEVWKYGETTNPKDRYDDAYLKKENVNFTPLFSGNQVMIKAMEKILIYDYFFEYGHLPPGNKIFR